LYIEIFVYFTFLFTLVFFVARSRIMKRCGINNSEQFEDTYMSYLANRLVQTIVFKGDQLNPKFTPKNYIDKDRTI
jgi:hypothetical protein